VQDVRLVRHDTKNDDLSTTNNLDKRQ